MIDDKHGQNKTLDALNARSLAAKREYVRELELRGDPQALASLVECLCDESGYLRDLAEQVLLRRGMKGADVLVPLLGQGLWYTRTSAARVLGRLGYRDAVPDLFPLTEDANETVSAAARDALVAIGVQRGAVRIAHALHRLPPDQRRRRLDEIATRERTLADRIDRLMRSEELMATHDPGSLSDDSPSVRAVEDGVEWEVLTGPPPPAPDRARGTGSGD